LGDGARVRRSFRDLAGSPRTGSMLATLIGWNVDSCSAQ
jgi:hypothetical protein